MWRKKGLHHVITSESLGNTHFVCRGRLRQTGSMPTVSQSGLLINGETTEISRKKFQLKCWSGLNRNVFCCCFCACVLLQSYVVEAVEALLF